MATIDTEDEDAEGDARTGGGEAPADRATLPVSKVVLSVSCSFSIFNYRLQYITVLLIRIEKKEIFELLCGLEECSKHIFYHQKCSVDIGNA